MMTSSPALERTSVIVGRLSISSIGRRRQRAPMLFTCLALLISFVDVASQLTLCFSLLVTAALLL